MPMAIAAAATTVTGADGLSPDSDKYLLDQRFEGNCVSTGNAENRGNHSFRTMRGNISAMRRSVLSRFAFSLFATLLAVSVSWADSGKAAQNAGASTENSELGALVLSHLGDYDEFPSGVPAHIEVRDDAVRKSSSGETVFPARISFQGVANSYCRLVVVSPSGDSALLVPVPSGYDNDQYQSVRLIAAVNLNNDLANDFVLGVRFPSNRYATIVDELRVYLSQKESATAFCLAGNLTHVSVERAVVDLVRAEIRRLGPSALECAN